MNRNETYRFVKEKFKDIVDKAEIPYISHLRHVEFLVRNYDEEIKIIALLHDILEDTDVTEEFLRENFTKRIVDAVVLLTRKQGQSYEDYIKQISLSADASIVKRADLTHNMDLTRLFHLHDKDIDRIKKYHKAYRKLIFNFHAT